MSAPAQQQRRRPASAAAGGGGGEKAGQRRGAGVEKRSHPAAAVPRGRHRCHYLGGGDFCSGGAATAAAAEATGSPVISHLSKGGRFSGEGEARARFLGKFSEKMGVSLPFVACCSPCQVRAQVGVGTIQAHSLKCSSLLLAPVGLLVP